MQAIRVARRLRDASPLWSAAGVALAAATAAGGATLASDARAESCFPTHALVAHHQHHHNHHQQLPSQQQQELQKRHWGTPCPNQQPLLPHRPQPQQQQQQLPLCADLHQRYRVDSVIGRGGFGLVHAACSSQSNARVALKRVFKQTTTKAKFLQEVEILRSLGGRHNVLALCEAFETEDAYVLVTELVDGQELFDELMDHGAFDELRAQSLVREMATTLAYLHGHGIVHGDLKPENILLSNPNNSSSSSTVTLIDFGQSFRHHIASERTRCMGSGVATVAYAAPEVVAHTSSSATTTSATSATSAIDMWALGVVLYVVLCGVHPFDPQNDASDAEIAARIGTGEFENQSKAWTALPPQARDLITQLLQVDAAKRPTARDVQRHAWLTTTEELM